MLDVRKNAIVIPLAAVQRGTQGSYVYTVKSGHANLQPVKVDLTWGTFLQSFNGVGAGDQVVVDGQDRLQSGAAVEVHNASPNGPAGGASGDPSSSPGNGKARGLKAVQGLREDPAKAVIMGRRSI